MTRRRSARVRQARELALAYLGSLDPREVALSRIIGEHIERVIEACDGNISLAAELLGVNRRSLQRHRRRRASASPRARAR